jgi:signal transduction histidine kinase
MICVHRSTEGKNIQLRLEEISAELQNLNLIFETILRISRIEAAQHGQGFATIDLNALIADIAETYEAVMENAGQNLRIADAEMGLAIIRGDRSMLFQLMANLVENIIKYTPSGSIAILSASRLPGGACVLAIVDNGPGIPANLLSDILLPFRRAEASRSTPGNGLGLALVNAITIHHNASLSLKDNAPGLRVEITFPVA